MNAPQSPPQRSALDVAVKVLGALAGAVAFLYVLGGAVMWLRFRHVGVPPMPAISTVSPRSLIAIALTEVIVPMMRIGVIVLLAFAVSDRFRRQGERRDGTTSSKRPDERIAAALLILLLALMTPGSFYGFVRFLSWVVPVAVGLWLVRNVQRFSQPLLLLAATVVGAAGIAAIARATDEPSGLPTATITLESGEPIQGALVDIGTEHGPTVGLCHQVRHYPAEQIRSVAVTSPPASALRSKPLLFTIAGIRAPRMYRPYRPAACPKRTSGR